MNGDVPAEVIAPARDASASDSASTTDPASSQNTRAADAADDVSNASDQATSGASSSGATGMRESSDGAATIVRDYVLNTSSRKFHAPDCPSCADISDDNRQDYHGTRDDLLARGYEPCGSCRP